MPLTRKVFIELAREQQSRCPSDRFTMEFSHWLLECDAIVRVCKRANPNFAQARFLAACQPEPSEKESIPCP